MAGEESKPREPLNSAPARKKKGFVTKVKESLTITKRELKKLKKRRCYHCCMQNRSTGRPCPGTRINSSDIFKHLRRDLHFLGHTTISRVRVAISPRVSLSAREIPVISARGWKIFHQISRPQNEAPHRVVGRIRTNLCPFSRRAPCPLSQMKVRVPKLTNFYREAVSQIQFLMVRTWYRR